MVKYTRRVRTGGSRKDLEEEKLRVEIIAEEAEKQEDAEEVI